jgi:hypothetical protein
MVMMPASPFFEKCSPISINTSGRAVRFTMNLKRQTASSATQAT